VAAANRSQGAIDAQETLLRAGGPLTEEGGDRLFATGAESGTSGQAHAGAAYQDDAGQRGDEVGAHGLCERRRAAVEVSRA
jgi:hypothetical protein